MRCFGKKIKSYHCKIVLLDETELIQEIQDAFKGQDLLDIVFKHLNLLETAYFGLRFIDTNGQTHWLDTTKKLKKQLKGADSYTLYFGVKFYASDPCKLLEEITRYQFFLQIKQDILQGRLPVSFDLTVELFALSVQSELGDYDARRHQPGYISEFRFLNNQTPELEAKVAEVHKGLVGQVPAIAEMNFLNRVKWLDMYGVDLHPVLGEDNIEYFLGLTPSGIIVLRNKTKVGNYFWPRITKVYFKGRYFMLRVRDKNNDENTFGFELPNKHSCKHLWKCSVEHHSFFRLTQVREIPGQASKVFGLGSRFRYSGRTERQVQVEVQQGRRPPPTVTRVPIRRYQHRLGQPDGADAGTQAKEISKETVLTEYTKSNNLASQTIYISSVQNINPPQPSNSPQSTRSAPWEDPTQRNRGLYSNSTNPSPRSVRSAGARASPRFTFRRTSSVESNSSYEYRKRRHHRSRRGSDNESEISKISKGSQISKSSQKSRSKKSSRNGDNASDSDSHNKHKRHSRRHKFGSNYELVSSENQWKEIQKQKQDNSFLRPQNAVVRNLANRNSGYINSGLETESEINYQHKKKHRRHRSRSRSPDNKCVLPQEIKKHIEYKLIDSTNMSQDELKDIKYTKVEVDSRLFKIRYSPSSGRPHYRVAKVHTKSSLNGSSNKLQGEEDDDPPPPYSPHGTNDLNHGLVTMPELPLVISTPNSAKIASVSRIDNSISNYSPVNNHNKIWQLTSEKSSSYNALQNKPDVINSSLLKEEYNTKPFLNDQVSQNNRLTSSQLYPSNQNTTSCSYNSRVSFQPSYQSYNKMFTSHAWNQRDSRSNGETTVTQNNHEMSTEL